MFIPVVVRPNHSTTETLPQLQHRRERLFLAGECERCAPGNEADSSGSPISTKMVITGSVVDLRRRMKGERMKTRTKTLAMAGLLICSFALTSSMARADADDWYQGRRGHWVQQHDEWRFRGYDGGEYRRAGNSWRWYNGRRHGAEGRAYHNRAPGDNRTFNQFEHQGGH